MKKTITRFMDLCGGGYTKTPYTHIYIDEPANEAIKTFKDLLGCDPTIITCQCCGSDFAIDEYSSIEEATAYDRKCNWNGKSYNLKTSKMTVKEYFQNEDVLFLCD